MTMNFTEVSGFLIKSVSVLSFGNYHSPPTDNKYGCGGLL